MSMHVLYRCRDYVRVNRPGYRYTESCGYVSNQDNQNQLEEGPHHALLKLDCVGMVYICTNIFLYRYDDHFVQNQCVEQIPWI